MFLIPTETPGRLLIALRPRGGDWLEVDVEQWKRNQLQLIVSTLTADEAKELNLDGEESSVRKQGLDFLSYPIADRSLPESDHDFKNTVQRLAEKLREGITFAVHCRQGIGRSGMIAIGILQELGIATKEAIRRVSEARGIPVPETEEQCKWIVRRHDPHA